MVAFVSDIPLMRTLLIFLIATTALLAGEGQKSHRLFHIDRSKDVDIVVYDVVTVDGKLHPDEPLDIYWIVRRENSQRDELNWIERWKGYGVDIEKQWGSDSLQFVMRADDTHIRVTRRNGKWVALTMINKVVARLQSIYVKTDESGWFPEVLEVHMKGKLTDGTTVVEVLKPD